MLGLTQEDEPSGRRRGGGEGGRDGLDGERLHLEELLHRVVPDLTIASSNGLSWSKLNVLGGHDDDGRGSNGESPACLSRDDEDSDDSGGEEFEDERSVRRGESVVVDSDSVEERVDEGSISKSSEVGFELFRRRPQESVDVHLRPRLGDEIRGDRQALSPRRDEEDGGLSWGSVDRVERRFAHRFEEHRRVRHVERLNCCRESRSSILGSETDDGEGIDSEPSS